MTNFFVTVAQATINWGVDHPVLVFVAIAVTAAGTLYGMFRTPRS